MIQLQTLNRIITDGYDTWVTEYDLNEEYFSDYAEEFNFIKDFYNKYNTTPDMITFLDKFPKFDVVEVYEPQVALINRLRNDYVMRKYAEVHNELSKNPDKLLNNAYETVLYSYTTLGKILDESAPTKYSDWKELTSLGVETAEEAMNHHDDIFYPTGLDGLEELHGWNKNSDYVVICGRPNHGKSMFLCKFVAELLKANKTVAFYNGEMDASEVIFRIYSILTGESTHDLLYGKSQEAIDKFNKYMQEHDYKLYMATKKDFGNRYPNAQQLELFATKVKADALCIDQISWVAPNRRHKEEYMNVADISRQLKDLRDKLNIPVLLVAQLNRTKTQEKDVDLVQIAGSDVIGQDATKVLMIDWNKADNITKLSVAKNRSGKAFITCKYDLDYDRGQFRRPTDVTNELEGESEIEWMK